MTDHVEFGGRRLRSNTMWALVGEGVQFVVGSVAFFLLVDRLGPVEAGYYGAVLAIATFGLPLSSIGSQALLMRETAAGGAFRLIWPRSISTVALGGLCATLVAAAVHRWLLPEIPLWAFVLLFFSQAVLYATAEFGLVAAQAHRRLEIGALIRSSTGTFRLVAVGLFWSFGEPTVASWSVFAASSFLAASAVSLAIVARAFGAGPLGVLPTRSSVRNGLPFAFGSGSARALDALDRPMLVRLGPNDADAGLYNVGYRLVQLSMTPISALVRASDADVFAAGAQSTGHAFRVARRLSSRASMYAIIAGVGLFVAAPLVPMLLGEEWQEAVDVVRFLAPLPLIKALQVFPANALTSSGRQSIRNRILLLAIGVNAALNLWLIPQQGWQGAALATLVAETVMVVSLWSFLLRPLGDRVPAS